MSEQTIILRADTASFLESIDRVAAEMRAEFNAAIDYAIDRIESPADALAFLQSWRDGSVDALGEWPEWQAWRARYLAPLPLEVRA